VREEPKGYPLRSRAWIGLKAIMRWKRPLIEIAKEGSERSIPKLRRIEYNARVAAWEIRQETKKGMGRYAELVLQGQTRLAAKEIYIKCLEIWQTFIFSGAYGTSPWIDRSERERKAFKKVYGEYEKGIVAIYDMIKPRLDELVLQEGPGFSMEEYHERHSSNHSDPLWSETPELIYLYRVGLMMRFNRIDWRVEENPEGQNASLLERTRMAALALLQR